MRILLIDDERLAARALSLMLAGTGIELRWAPDGETGIELARLYDYNAILLDLALTGLHGYEVLRRLRQAKIGTPVMILSGDGEIASKVASFGFGADDYLTKPFHRDELVARVHALVRRSTGHAAAQVSAGSMVFDLTARLVTVAGRPVRLTEKEYSVVEVLALRKGNTITKEMILNHLYGGRDEPAIKIIDVFISKLRKKLAAAGEGGATAIRTVWGRGYAMGDPVG